MTEEEFVRWYLDFQRRKREATILGLKIGGIASALLILALWVTR